MKLLWAVPIILGSLTVLQAGMNRKIAAAQSLPFAALLNSLVLTGAATVVFLLSGGASRLPALRELSWTYVLPGLMGISFVLGGPWSVGRIGATATFLCIVSAQVATSLFWDWKWEGLSPSPLRLFGVGLCVFGAAVAALAK
jgi:uncharacterized membrane protein YdcZ (DUF606 family)